MSPKDGAKSLVRRAGRAIRGSDKPVAPASSTKEPCLACFEETAAGSAFFYDRLAVAGSSGQRGYLCSDCTTRARAAKMGEPLTDADLRVIADNGLMVGVGLGVGLGS